MAATRYVYRVVGWIDGPAGLIGLATTRDRAIRLAGDSRISCRWVRERVTHEVHATIRAVEEAGRIPRSLDLSLATRFSDPIQEAST